MGALEKAEEEKIRIELKQRNLRQHYQSKELEWVPKWFRLQRNVATGFDFWELDKEFWNKRSSRQLNNDSLDLW